MPHQNRVDPFGRLQADPARGGMMGNRGILHEDDQRILRNHAHQNWVTCCLAFRGRKRPLLTPGHYTELFFLDEATALAAGHRPCGECRRADYAAFMASWCAVHGAPPPGLSLPKAIDKALHAARIDRRGRKVTYQARTGSLPDGVMVALTEAPALICGGRLLRWSFAGYDRADLPAPDMVTVLTPRPVVEVLRHGYRPMVHPTAGA